MSIAESMARAQAAVDAAMNIPLDTLHTDGVALLGLLATISVAVMGYKTMFAQGASGNLNAFGARVLLTVIALLALWWLVNDGYSEVFVRGLDASFVQIAEKLMPGAGTGSHLGAAAEIFMNVYNSIGAALNRVYEGSWGLGVLTATAKNLPAILCMLFSMMVIIFSMMAYMSMQIISVILVKLALIIGPIFLPWALFNQTSFLTAGWLRFFLSASLYKVLGKP